MKFREVIFKQAELPVNFLIARTPALPSVSQLVIPAWKFGHDSLHQDRPKIFVRYPDQIIPGQIVRVIDNFGDAVDRTENSVGGRQIGR